MYDWLYYFFTYKISYSSKKLYKILIRNSRNKFIDKAGDQSQNNLDKYQSQKLSACSEAEKRIQKRRDIKKEIKNYIFDNYDKILELNKPDGEFQFNPLDFGEENKVLFFDEIYQSVPLT